MSRQRSKPQRLRDLIHTPVWVMNLVLKYPSIASVPLSSIDLRAYALWRARFLVSSGIRQKTR
jgi:hypothetical protein